ncbi:MAG: hypothetical protein KF764_30890 [Labilithrix sp.]|nr:hypothetical protein [Labilithrix sp.]
MIRSIFARGLVLAFGVAACNTLLDNKPASLDPATTTDPIAPSDPTDAGHAPKGDDPDVPRRSDAGAAPLCSPTEQVCHGLCVAMSDPVYGCGRPTCEPCAIPHGSAGCHAGACVVETCDKGYADCNRDPADGCEVDLSRATSCGGCSARCAAATPVCAPTGDSFACSNGCAANAPVRCGNECVSPLTSVNHCGKCDTPCAAVEHAEVTCEAGACKLACRPSYHACAGACVVDTDPAACGAGCVVCPVPAHAEATCKDAACGFQCSAGFGNCNQDAADGCESNLATDPLHCGACGKSCNGGACNAGVCAPPPDAGP